MLPLFSLQREVVALTVFKRRRSVKVSVRAATFQVFERGKKEKHKRSETKTHFLFLAPYVQKNHHDKARGDIVLVSGKLEFHHRGAADTATKEAATATRPPW